MMQVLGLKRQESSWTDYLGG